MPNRVGTFNTFAGSAPPWSLPNLDANFSLIATAFNDASLGYSNYIGVDTGGANNYVVSCTFGVPTAYNVGMTFTFKPAVTNTGASTIAINSLGTSPIQHGDGTACIGGEIQAGKNVTLIYNGTAFQIQGPPFGYGTTLYYDYDDFVACPGGNAASPGNNGASKLMFMSCGTGTTITQPGSIFPGHPGVLNLGCGVTAGQNARVHMGSSAYLDTFTYTLRAIVQTPGTIDSNQIFFGLSGSFVTTLIGTNPAIGFICNSSSGFWQMLTGNGTTATTTASTQAISSGTWYDLMIVANAAGATFFVNGTQAGTQSVTYPSSSTQLIPGFSCGASGIANRVFIIDLFEITITGIPIITGSTNPRFTHSYV